MSGLIYTAANGVIPATFDSKMQTYVLNEAEHLLTAAVTTKK
jgi:hypothetical protein